MERLCSLPELVAKWREASGPLVEKMAEEIAYDLTAQGAPSREIVQGRLRTASTALVTACRDWLEATGRWEMAAPLASCQNDLAGALADLPRPGALLPAPVNVVSPWAWTLPAALGAIAGALGLAQITRWLFGPQEGGLFTGGLGAAVSLFFGGVLGATALVSAFAFLATRPAYLATLCELLPGQGPAVREPKSLKDGLPVLAAWVAVWALRPRALPPLPEECRVRLREHLAPLLRQHADLVLAWCRPSSDSAPIVSPPPPATMAPLKDGLDNEVLAAVTALWSVRQVTPVSPEQTQAAADALLQRLEEDGLAWRAIPHGALYADEMTKEFDCFGLLAPGQPVETLRPAVLYRDEVRARGLLRRLRS